MPREESPRRTRAAQAALWLPGLLVAVGAGVATAHGLYEVAVAAAVPAPIAWLYPLITDGLALVAYATTARLDGRERRYAWTVVVLAAGLSGLAQASYLAGGLAAAPVPLRFGIGAWPAIAAAIVAHLLYLIATAHSGAHDEAPAGQAASAPAPIAAEPDTGWSETPAMPDAASNRRADESTVRFEPLPVDASNGVQPEPVQPPVSNPVQPEPAPLDAPVSNTGDTSTVVRSAERGESTASPRVRAERAARVHADRHGAWPSARELADTAGVSRGTAAAALKTLRDTPTPLHIVTEQTPSEAQQ